MRPAISRRSSLSFAQGLLSGDLVRGGQSSVRERPIERVVSRKLLDLAIAHEKAGGQVRFPDDSPVIGGAPDPVLSQDDDVAPDEGARRGQGQSGPSQPLPQKLAAPPGTARADDLDIRCRQREEPIYVLPIRRVLPRLNDS